jgi:hypothetical protein
VILREWVEKIRLGCLYSIHDGEIFSEQDMEEYDD